MLWVLLHWNKLFCPHSALIVLTWLDHSDINLGLFVGSSKCRWSDQTVRVAIAFLVSIWHSVLLHSVFANALITASFSIGSIIGPQTFQAKDAPHYIPAKITLLATQSAAIVVVVIARMYYGWQNSHKEKVIHMQKTIKDIEWLNCKCPAFKLRHMQLTKYFLVTDKENTTFRYQY